MSRMANHSGRSINLELHLYIVISKPIDRSSNSVCTITYLTGAC
ncbi:hypothetical protein CKA32_000640 [Geitlerinema sp. FC II]|nr:hypothetical protein CKA32_000640 [Geitlerinema sp. FC II]